MKTNTYSQLTYLRENFAEIALACQPLWHPLGFVSCVVRREGEEFTTRIHYWPKSDRRTKSPDWPIHNHAYELSSRILYGRVHDMQYSLKEGTDHALYSVSYSGEDSTIKCTSKKTSIEKVIDRIHETGMDYSISRGSFHQTHVPKDESAVTLVVLSDFGGNKPLVLGAIEGNCYRYDRDFFDKSAFWSRMRDVIRPS